MPQQMYYASITPPWGLLLTDGILPKKQRATMPITTTQSFLGHDLSRRAFVRRAIAGAGILSLPDVMRLRVEAALGPEAKKRSLILLWQDGGPSHFETFDPKPEAPVEFRGELEAIQTTLPGIQFCEVLPRLAHLAHRFSVIRSLHQPSSDHVVGSHNVLTGWDDESEGSRSRYPDLASVVSRKRTEEAEGGAQIGESTDPRLAMGLKKSGARRDAGIARQELPRYVGVSNGLHRGGPAFLGPIHAPFAVADDPSKPDFVVQNLQMSGAPEQLAARLKMLQDLDRFGRTDPGLATMNFTEQMQATDAFRGQALDLLTGSGAARAFDLSREPKRVRLRYGLHTAGQQCLLARRLVEAGVNVVAVRFCPDGRGDYDKAMIGWDDHAVHGNIFAIMRQRGPQFDQSVSALIEDLSDRGLENEVLVVVVGEFGRTPRVQVHKGCPGRDHWGPAGCALVFGGGLNMGQVVGSTNDKGELPLDRPLKYQSLLATIYHSLGINHEHTFLNSAGRPVPILSQGEVIRELARG